MRKYYLLFNLFFIASTPLYAQREIGSVSGKVTDAAGQPLPYINIAAEGTRTGTRTDEKGNFLLRLPKGHYIMSAGAMGYARRQMPVAVSEGKTADISFALASDTVLMQEVVVSGVKMKSAAALRTLTQIQDIPQSVAVIGQKVIRQQAAFDMSTIARNISGLNFTGNYSGAGSAQFFNARGFDLNDSQNYRWNGMMIWNFGNHYSDNIEQVEFLKGPASVLFGDVSPGGVMNFVTKKPLAEFKGEVNFKTGSWGLIRPAVDITGPLTANRTLRFRVNGSYEKSNSFRDYVSSRKAFIAPAIAWDITRKLSLNVETVFKQSGATDDAGLVSPDGTISGLKELPPSLYLGEPSLKYRYKGQTYFATLEYELHKSWRLKTTAFFGHVVNRPFGIWFDQPDANGDFARRKYGFRQKSNNGTISVTALGSFYTASVKHNVLAGADYQSTHNRYTNAGTLSLLDTNNIFHPVYDKTAIQEPAGSPYQPYVSVISRTGLFLQDQMMFFNETLHVLLGIRAGRTRQGNHYFQDELEGTGYEGYTDDIISKNVVTPRIGLVYKPSSSLSLYASYAEGYEINSPDIFAKNYRLYATPPATLSNQTEFGAKANLLKDKLGLTVSTFQINKHNPYGYLYLNPENPNYDEYNVYYEGHHRSMGIELDAEGNLFPTLSITAAAAFTRARVLRDPGYPAGNMLPNAPKLTANLWLHYQGRNTLKGFSLGAGVFYKGKFFSGLANDAALQIPHSYTVDLSAGYQYKRMGAQMNVMNITNQVSYLNPWQFNLFDVKPLRQIVLTLSYQIFK